jgi:hypothetical protein
MMGGGWPVLALLSCTLTAAGCATGGAPGREPASRLPAPAETGSAACFVRRLVTSFTVLDDTNLVVFAPSRTEAFHVRIRPAAPEMAGAAALAFTSRGHQVCGAAEDAVFFGQERSAPRHAITGVSRLSEAALNELLALTALAASEPG